MISILDCTLRDGGYVNDWNFNTDVAYSICDGLYRAGVRWIEIGILGDKSIPGEQTKYASFEEIKPLLQNRKIDCHYAVMVTTNNSDKFYFPKCSAETPDVIRIAYLKTEYEKTLELAKELIEKGYSVFMQAMATYMYSGDELRDMVKAINQLKPHAFYMVDSYSTMYPADVVKMRDTILEELDNNIMFGFHAHNNIQMAFANVQKFIEVETEHKLVVDGTIFGMGRGAGNLPTELVMNYLNRMTEKIYNASIVLDLYQKYIEPIYREYGWGYAIPYYLTAINAINSAWYWYFKNNGITCVHDLEKALKMIPIEWKEIFNVSIGKQIVDFVKGESNE